MSPAAWAGVVLGALALLYVLLVVALLLAGRRADARALARFLPDCLVLFRRLLADERISRRRKWVLIALVAYLVSPIDLIPDFLPGIGQLDDLVISALALRSLLRGVDPRALSELWPGPPESLAVLTRLVYGEAEGADEVKSLA